MIKRWTANKDNTIRNAYRMDLTTRATASNSGMADVLETYVIYGQANSSSAELSRILVEFSITSIYQSRDNGTIPQSGSVSFYLNLYNAEHSFTVPRKYTLAIQPISRSWNEGYGLDMDGYWDEGVSNWLTASSGSSGYVGWTNNGGDYHTGAYNEGLSLPAYTQYFETGIEDLSLDITSLTEEWIANSNGEATTNYGVGIYMSGSIETAQSSSYTKQFFGRGSEFFFKRPVIEARWDSSYKDARGNFYNSSSLASATDNLNTLYLYNYVRGQLKNIPDISTGNIYLKIFTTATGSNEIRTITPRYPVTGGYHSVGVYTASFALNTSASVVYDRWYGANFTTCYFTGSAITVKSLNSYNFNPSFNYVAAITNLKPVYSPEEKANFRVFVRDKDHQPTIYSVAKNQATNAFIEDLYYRVKRVTDGLVVLDWGTGSMNHTRLGYDESGSYCDIDMEIFEPGYMYQMNFLYKTTANDYREMKQSWKFRVDK